MDLFEHNKRQYLLIVDYFSKFPFICKLHSLSTGTVINELKGLFSENGIPEVVISDGGPQFRFEFRNFAQEWGFQHIQSSPYHHQSNGEAERFVRTVKDTLQRHIRVAKTQTWHYYATDLHQSALNYHRQQN